MISVLAFDVTKAAVLTYSQRDSAVSGFVFMYATDHLLFTFI